MPGKATRPAKCDCLNYCGDDPWLNDGRAEPCEESKACEKKAAAARAERDRIKGIASVLAATATANGTATVSARDMADIQRLLNNEI